MRTTPIGIALINDEREHVYSLNSEECTKVVNQWADVIRNGVKNVDGTSPKVVVGSEMITSVRSAQNTPAPVKIVVKSRNAGYFRAIRIEADSSYQRADVAQMSSCLSYVPLAKPASWDVRWCV